MSRFSFAPLALSLTLAASYAQVLPKTVPPPPSGSTPLSAEPAVRTKASASPDMATSSASQENAVAKPLRVSRFRNPATRRHVFTTDADTQQLFPSSFVKETVPKSIASSPFFYVYTEHYMSTVPIYQFRAADGSMLFAANQNERREFLNRGLQETQQPVFVYDHKVEGSSEVLRLMNPQDRETLYTTSPDERDYYANLGWIQLSSLGYTQSTSSSGTGILRDETVKLESEDLALISQSYGRGQRILFSGTNPKITAINVGTILYSERHSVLPLGLVAKVTGTTWTLSGELAIDTSPAELSDAFVEFHIYLDNQPIYFLSPGSDDAQGAKSPAFSPRQAPNRLPQHSAEQPLGGGFATPQILGVEQSPEDLFGESKVRPDYLSEQRSYAIGFLPDGAYWSQDLNYNKALTSTLSVNGDLTMDATVELIWNSYNVNYCPANPTIVFFLSPHVHGSINLTATAQVSAGQDNIKVLGPYSAVLGTIYGIPISADVNLLAGYSASASLTASLGASVDAHMTSGVQFNTSTYQFSDIWCPNPCWSGFTCGPTRATGPTCAFSPSVTGSITTAAQALVYLKPQLVLYAGAYGTGLGPSAYAKLQLRAVVASSNLNLYTELIPGVGAKVTVCNYPITEYEHDFSTLTYSYLLKSFPLGGSEDPDVTSLVSRTFPVGWYFFTGPSGRWYIANTAGNVLALEAPANYPASGTLPWKPISNYSSAYAGYPAAGVNYSNVQIASNGMSVSFGSLKGGGGDTEVSQLANTTQPVKWMYFQDSRTIWYIFDSYAGSQAVMRLMGYDSSVSGGVLWKPINNYPAYVGYPAAGFVFQSVSASGDGRSIIFGPLK